MNVLVRLAFAGMAFLLSAASLAEDDMGPGGPRLRPAADPAPAATNYSDIWWNPNESGWGLTIADHETQLFAVWYTYDFSGRPTWFVIPGGSFSQGRRFFAGTVYQTRGPCYRFDSFDPSQVTASPVGTANIDFAPPDLPAGWARFSGLIGATSWSKKITRQPFGIAVPNWGTDFTDIWWNSAESGWGLALSQHGNNIFGVLFTYDCDGSPLFVALPGVTFQSPSAFSGTLYTTTSSGGWWGSPAFNASGVTVSPVGSASIAFNGRSGQFSYTINGASRSQHIDQQPFGNARPASPPPTTTTRTLTVGLNGTGSGNVVSSPSGISCGATCSAAFTNGATVVLTATPSAGSTFSGWGGDCTGTGTCTLAMSASHGVTATFNANTPAPPGAKACAGQYSMTVNIAFMGCTNASHTFVGDLTITGIDFDAVSRNAPSQFAGLLSVTNVSDVFAGFPGECRPVNLREVLAPFTGFMNISRIGSADAIVLDEELHFQFSLGSMNTVLGTITGPEVTGGHFSCTY